MRDREIDVSKINNYLSESEILNHKSEILSNTKYQNPNEQNGF